MSELLVEAARTCARRYRMLGRLVLERCGLRRGVFDCVPQDTLVLGGLRPIIKCGLCARTRADPASLAFEQARGLIWGAGTSPRYAGVTRRLRTP